MDNPRNRRIQKFNEFREEAEALFESYSKEDKSAVRLRELFSFHVCKGGRAGGLNLKQVEIFFGNRPIDQIKELGSNFNISTRFEVAEGATLLYERTDDGRVACMLYPAKTENLRPSESMIMLDLLADPGLLKSRARMHWEMFISYMEATCIDGEPTLGHRLKVFYLRNFKRYVEASVAHGPRVYLFFREILKYVLTIGFSGFLLVVITMIKDCAGADEDSVSRKEMLIVSRKTFEEISTMSKRVDLINDGLSDVVQTLKASKDNEDRKMEKIDVKP